MTTQTKNNNIFSSFDAGRLTSGMRRVLGSVNGMLQRNLGRSLLKVVYLVPRVMGIKSSIYLIKSLLAFSRHAYVMRKKSGFRFLVIYLKACHTLLQQNVCGQRLSDTGPFGARVSRSKGGLPSWIPVQFRQRIRKGDKMAIRLWLSLFSIYRVIDIRGRVNLSTITAPSTADLGLLPEFDEFVSKFYLYISSRWSREGSITDAFVKDRPWTFLEGLVAGPRVTSSAGPVLTGKGGKRFVSTSPLSILLTARVWMSDEYSALWNVFQKWCSLTNSEWVVNCIRTWASGPKNPIDKGMAISKRGTIIAAADVPSADRNVGTHLRLTKPLYTTWNFFLAKLGLKQEAAGKVRVFAMVDCCTQWLLEPLHDAIFRLLEVIPQDGTHDQTKPLDHLIKRQRDLRLLNRSPGSILKRGTVRGREKLGVRTWGMFSFDLSAATDRLPVIFQEHLLRPILGEEAAGLWSSLLVDRAYLVPRREDLNLPGGSVKYSTGQPMGALSSWAMLALTHHCIVQWAWYRVCKEVGRDWTWYEDYAVLGDDVVILGNPVAKAYVKLMTALGVVISAHKSLISSKGIGFEFAKRTYLKGEPVGAISILELMVAQKSLGVLLELVRKHKMTVGQYLSFLGYGYKSKGRASVRLMNLPRRMRNYLVAFFSPGMPQCTSVLKWLSMRSIDNVYETGSVKVGSLFESFLATEKKSLSEALDRLQPFMAIVNELIQLRKMYPDGTSSKRLCHASIRQRSHPGVYPRVERHVLNHLDCHVYYEVFHELWYSEKILRAKVAVLNTLKLCDIQLLWDLVAELQRDLGALPLPKNLTLKGEEKASRDSLSVLKRWELYSRVFRSTRSS